MAFELVDIGINLAHDSFDPDRDAVIERARRVGVTHFIVTGSSFASTRAAIELVKARPGMLRATAGIHPHNATELTPERATELEELQRTPQVCAAGECGLDYFRDFSPRVDQRRAFAAQLEIAARTRRPLFLHQRDAHADFVTMLRERRDSFAAGVAHCFTGGVAELEAYLELDLHIGITGWICDERRGRALQEAVSRIPAGRLMLETDGPYLLPRDLQPRPASRRNEPMYLPHILSTVARFRGESEADLARAITATTRAFFAWPP